MTVGRVSAGVVAALVAAGSLAAQHTVADRLRGRVPGDVAAAVERVARDAAAQGLPVEPLVQKTIEGAAKGVSGPRIVAAVQGLAARLGTAARAVRAGGETVVDAATIEAGAFALATGIPEAELVRLAGAGRPAHAVAMTLRVAGALAALGVPANESAELVVRVLEAGLPPAEVVSLPAAVQVGIGRGLTPSDAASVARAAGVAKGAKAAARPGPAGRPPQGPPDKKPPRPTGPPQGPPVRPLPGPAR